MIAWIAVAHSLGSPEGVWDGQHLGLTAFWLGLCFQLVLTAVMRKNWLVFGSLLVTVGHPADQESH